MLFVVAVGNITLFIFKAAIPAGMSIFFTDFNLSLPQGMTHKEFLCHQLAVRQVIGVHVAVFIFGAAAGCECVDSGKCSLR